MSCLGDWNRKCSKQKLVARPEELKKELEGFSVPVAWDTIAPKEGCGRSTQGLGPTVKRLGFIPKEVTGGFQQ
jgi:hypothetical protein